MHKLIRDIVLGLIVTAIASLIYIVYENYRDIRYRSGKHKAEVEVIKCTNKLIHDAKKISEGSSIRTDHEKCIDYAKSASERFNDKSILAQAYIGLSRALWEIDNLDYSIEYQDKAIGLLEYQLQEYSINDKGRVGIDIKEVSLSLAEAYFDNGWNYAHTGKFEESNYYYQESLSPKFLPHETAHLEDSPFFDAHIQMAINYKNLGMRDNAIEAYQKYIEGSKSRVIRVKVENNGGEENFLYDNMIPYRFNYNCIVQAHLDLANLYIGANDERQCISEYNKAKDLLDQTSKNDFFLSSGGKLYSRCPLYKDLKNNLIELDECNIGLGDDFEQRAAELFSR